MSNHHRDGTFAAEPRSLTAKATIISANSWPPSSLHTRRSQADPHKPKSAKNWQDQSCSSFLVASPALLCPGPYTPPSNLQPSETATSNRTRSRRMSLLKQGTAWKWRTGNTPNCDNTNKVSSAPAFIRVMREYLAPCCWWRVGGQWFSGNFYDDALL